MPKKLIALALATCALAGVLSAVASAAPIDDKKAEARRVQAQLDRLNTRMVALDEQFNQARLRASKAKADAARVRAEMVETEARMGDLRGQLAGAAQDAYMHGTDSAEATAMFDASSAQEMAERRHFLDDRANSRKALLDDLAATQEDLDAQERTLSNAEKTTAAAEKSAAGARREAASVVSQQRSLMRRVTGELADLVAAEARRKAAAEQAATEARIRSEAARLRTTATKAGDATRTSRPLPPVGKGAGAAIEAARSRLGLPYEWGGSGPDSFDCSGLTMWSWKHGGVGLPHSSKSQYSSLPKVPISEIQPGDLVFFGSPIHHVGMYVGGGQMIDAPHSGANVRYTNIYRSDLVGAARPS